MKLVIVESPTKARTLSRFLGNGYAIEASMGHLRDLPKSKLGVDLENDFEPIYELSEGKSKLIAKLKKEAKEADKIFLATDPDREGEAISWHIKTMLHDNGQKKSLKIAEDKFARVTFHEITKTAIEAAVNNPTQLNLALVDAQQARRVVDRLVGYTLSPVLWKKVRRGLSAGRVQSVALRLMVEREKEIAAFKPVEYWEVKVHLKKTVDDRSKIVDLWVELVDQELGSAKVVEPLVADLKKATYMVVKVEKKEKVRRPYPPYITSTLQQASANVLGYTAKDTMRLAQELYEKGLITYHRTDSLNLAAEAVNGARDYIKTQYGEKYLPPTANFYKTNSKNAQEAHEAIRPTDARTNALSETENGFTSKHVRLYRLIWQRFIACQMMPAIYDATMITVMADKTYKLRASGSVVKFDGWRILYNTQTQTTDKEEIILPELTEGEQLKYEDLTSEQKFTQPPARYNDASLVKELEKRGIGRPSTYASIISTVVARGYVERVEKRLIPSAVGQTVTDFLGEHFPDILDYEFTAEMEEDLDRIARGEKEWRKIMKAFYTPFAKQVKKVEETAKRAAVPVEETGEMCPECKEGKLVIRSGRFGKFLSCGRFPECKYTASYTKKLEGFECPKCKGEVVMKRTKRGRSFWGCANYPKCDYASWKDPRETKIQDS